MNTNYFARIMAFGLVFILMAGCRPKENGTGYPIFSPGKTLKSVKLEDYKKKAKNYAEFKSKIEFEDYEDEIIISANDLFETIKQIKENNKSYEDHMNNNQNHHLYISLRKGLSLVEDLAKPDTIQHYLYFSMGEKQSLVNDNSEFKPVVENNDTNEVLIFNELMRCPTMCPTGPIFSDFNHREDVRTIPRN